MFSVQKSNIFIFSIQQVAPSVVPTVDVQIAIMDAKGEFLQTMSIISKLTQNQQVFISIGKYNLPHTHDDKRYGGTIVEES